MEKFEKPFFTIVIPALNEERVLPDLLKDLTQQTYKNFETVVVDGKSDDKTVKRANNFKNKLRLKTITSEKRSVSYQRNLGAKQATCNWIIFFDADNRLPKYFLQGIKFWIEVYNPDVLSSWIEPDGKDGKDKAISTITNVYAEIQRNTSKPSVLESFLCIKKRSFNILGGFNERLSWGEGGELLERAVKKRMRFQLVKNPRYTYSFRRLRKQGTLGLFRRFAQLEVARLINKRVIKTQVVYPMEGGNFYEVDKDTASRIEKLVLKIMATTPAKKIIKNDKHGLIDKFFKLFFRKAKN